MTHQTNEELIEEFKNHLDYYKDLKGKWEFLKTPEDRAFHAGKTQGMLLGLEVIERISITQPEQLKKIGTITPFVFKDIEYQEAFIFVKEGNLKVTNEEE